MKPSSLVPSWLHDRATVLFCGTIIMTRTFASSSPPAPAPPPLSPGVPEPQTLPGSSPSSPGLPGTARPPGSTGPPSFIFSAPLPLSQGALHLRQPLPPRAEVKMLPGHTDPTGSFPRPTSRALPFPSSNRNEGTVRQPSEAPGRWSRGPPGPRPQVSEGPAARPAQGACGKNTTGHLPSPPALKLPYSTGHSRHDAVPGSPELSRCAKWKLYAR